MSQCSSSQNVQMCLPLTTFAYSFPYSLQRTKRKFDREGMTRSPNEVKGFGLIKKHASELVLVKNQY